MTLNDKWQDLWVKYIEIPDTVKSVMQYTAKMALAIHRILEAIRQAVNVLINCFRSIRDKLRLLFDLEDIKPLKDTNPEEITCNNCRCSWTNYNYKPQLMKVNTKGYSRCFLPVTRRYI